MVKSAGNNKLSKGDVLFDGINFIILTIVLLSVIYPLYFIIVASFSDPDGIYQGKVWLKPYLFNLEGYKAIFNYKDIWIGYRNSIVYTTVGVIINLICTFTLAYPLSKKRLPGKGVVTFLMVLTLYINGGLIPSYLLVRNLGLLDTMWSLVLPPAVGVMNVIIIRTFFQSTIPDELFESAVLDGCSHTRYFFQILLPLSGAVIAVMVLFNGVGHWNSYFGAMIYISTKAKYPLQLVLRDILVVVDNTRNVAGTSGGDQMAQMQMDAQALRELLKYGLIIVSSLPVLVLYPFLQKYFVKGVMIGSLKG